MQEKASRTARTGTFLLAGVLLLLTVVASQAQAVISIVVSQDKGNAAGLMLALKDIQYAVPGSAILSHGSSAALPAGDLILVGRPGEVTPLPGPPLKPEAFRIRAAGLAGRKALVIEGDEHSCLIPHGRYGKMRNVWFIPSVAMLNIWLNRSGFKDIKVVDVCPTTVDEQRSTDWMQFESLSDFLDPNNPNRTIEGYPAPIRAILTAKK